LRGLLRQGRLRLELTVVKVGRALGLLPRGLHARQHLRLRARRPASLSKRTRCHIHKLCAACLAHADRKSPRPSVAARKQPRRRARAAICAGSRNAGRHPAQARLTLVPANPGSQGKAATQRRPWGPPASDGAGRAAPGAPSCGPPGAAPAVPLSPPPAAPAAPVTAASLGPQQPPTRRARSTAPPPRLARGLVCGGARAHPRQATQRPGRWQLQHGPRRMQHTQARRAERGQARARKTDTAPGRSRRTVAAPCTSRRRMTSVPRASASVTCARPPAPRRAPARAPRGAAAAPQRACA